MREDFYGHHGPPYERHNILGRAEQANSKFLGNYDDDNANV
jgi:hypothetical protein